MVLALLTGMVYGLVFSSYGYLVYRQEQQHLSTLQTEIVKLQQQREKLAKEILRLRHDPNALEELVHRELGYVHPDEYMLILPKKSKSGHRGSMLGKNRHH